jgi:uncharacterized protein
MIARTRLAQAFAGIARTALIALALAVMTGPAAAEQQPAEPSANAVSMAREIIDLKGSTALFAPMVAGVVERVRTLHLQTNPNLRKDLDAVAAMLRKQFDPRTADLLAQFSKYYASAFTEAELKQILAFYRTPTGKKVIAIEPGLLQDAVAGLKDWQEDFGEEVVSRFRTEMKKRGHDL